MQLDAPTVSVIVAAVTVTLDRAVALVKAARERASGGGRSCSTDHELMCKTLDRLATLQEKEVEILHGLSTSAEITKLMLQDKVGGRDRSYSPLTVELIRELDRRRDKLSDAREQMSDPPPKKEKDKR